MFNARNLLTALAISLTTAVACAAPGDIQGNITGPNNKPVADAQVTLQRKDQKSPATTVHTDTQGRYVFKNVALTGVYGLTVSANSMAPTTANNVKPLSNGAVRVDFNLKMQGGKAQAAAPKPKAKQMVWVPATTGTNIGGKWVEVGTESANTNDGMDNTQRKSAAAVGAMQSGSSATRGGE